MQSELVKDYQDELNLLPTRATKGSAGYDFSRVGQMSYLIHKGDRIMQGIVIDYHVANNDITTSMRMGGFGSTGKK